MRVHLQLPFPPKTLSPNDRPNRWDKSAAIRDYRGICKVEALVARDRKTIALKAPVKARVTFVCHPRLWDEDNCTAAFKAGWDGIVDSGLIPGDSPDLLHVETEVIKGSKAMVLVRLEDGS
jgi:crossover junction endodeoxyribonuclease RusA